LGREHPELNPKITLPEVLIHRTETTKPPHPETVKV